MATNPGSSFFSSFKTSTAAAAAGAASAIGPPNRSWILYLGLAIVICLVIWMLLGKTISISWIDPRPQRMKVYQSGYLFWPPSKIFSNLVVPLKNDIPDFHDDSFSMLLDVILLNSRNYNTTEGPYRQIVHRGSADLAKADDANGLAPAGFLANVINQPLPPFGLPKRMNPGVFLDPNTNDLLVFVDSALGSQTFRESVRIADIPLDTPFRIGIIISNRVVEVYINCRLEVTKVLSGIPKRVEREWYGLAGSAAAQAQIQNLYIWNKPLTAIDMRPLCPTIPAFTSSRPLCDTTETSTFSVSAALSSVVPTSVSTAIKSGATSIRDTVTNAITGVGPTLPYPVVTVNK